MDGRGEGRVHEQVTLLRPDPPSAGERQSSSTLPADLLEQVRKRLRLITAIIISPSAINPLLFGISWTPRADPNRPENCRAAWGVWTAGRWTEGRARDWWATHKPVTTQEPDLPTILPACIIEPRRVLR